MSSSSIFVFTSQLILFTLMLDTNLHRMPSPAIAHFSKADLWHCGQISRQHGDRVYHNHLLNIAYQFASDLFFSPRT
jgi:hypothetical protein